MSDHEMHDAVEAFLNEADDAYGEYEQGYTDADATLRRLETAIEELRTSTEE
ncbi:hypothetical protein BDK61_3236 [Haloarcula quadrata]|jgi:archaellum component FlaC|uniref:Uncharacterized protein n=3 Tax=Haloarcula TaxID=2237 RepID=Q5UX34_HALMA|nr:MULTISPECIES: hypothetical protein [Haloarcula]AAV48169.1 unknown [Haloarcula marismortui ATCC 43049]EMA12727.1 hypothetical protein C436_13270 [Haloarcula sinaiiensis ATCC 33800]NHN63249.1 hypothetical protein [Haloarcula sp. JP-Z28]NHX39111.1 hypothetical protein [Haloarcula sp. R1-2]QUJ71044.1 hypothetical protein KDQ40_09940 [Haloarcula sinaiiensis ATCC 33800]